MAQQKVNRGMVSPVKWPGSKGRYVDLLLPLLPTTPRYVEPFVGSASLFWRKPPSRFEVLNDYNAHLINFYQVLASPQYFNELVRALDAIPYSRQCFEAARDYLKTRTSPGGIEDAAAFLVANRQSMFGKLSTWAIDVERTNRPRQWAEVKEQLRGWHERLDGVYLECRDAVELIPLYDRPDTLFFLDPPYLGYDAQYKSEFTANDHLRLVEAVQHLRGPCLLCGYESELYDSHLAAPEWTRREWIRNNDMGKDGQAVEEVLWINYPLHCLIQDQEWSLF